jgi:hypothetical protein
VNRINENQFQRNLAISKRCTRAGTRPAVWNVHSPPRDRGRSVANRGLLLMRALARITPYAFLIAGLLLGGWQTQFHAAFYGLSGLCLGGALCVVCQRLLRSNSFMLRRLASVMASLAIVLACGAVPLSIYRYHAKFEFCTFPAPRSHPREGILKEIGLGEKCGLRAGYGFGRTHFLKHGGHSCILPELSWHC